MKTDGGAESARPLEQFLSHNLVTHLLEFDLSIKIDECGLEEIGRPRHETLVLWYERLDRYPAGLSCGLSSLREVILGRQ